MPPCPSRRPDQRSTKSYRFPSEIISRCVWLYYRFGVSLRDVSELMLARGIEVSHEAIRLWTLRFGTEYACGSRIRCQAATGSWTRFLQWETQRTWLRSAGDIGCRLANVSGVWPSNEA